mgnify:CR=1 FL=1
MRNPASNGTETPFNPRNVGRGLVMLTGVLLLGSMGYMILERWTFLDALYMTVITITTVGYGEIRAVSEAGRIFTIFLIFSGMGIMAYTLGLVAQVMIEMQVRSLLGRRKLGAKIKNMKNHYIICGYGRIGRIICRELREHRIPMLVIDHDGEMESALELDGIPFLIGDATSEEVLLSAGIDRAKGLVSVVSSDADNVFVTMSARGLNPDLFILARADDEKTQTKLLRAGADRVVLPYRIGGQKMAQTIVRPAVTDFLELTVSDKAIELKIEELPVQPGSRLDGVTLVDSGIRQDHNVMIVAIRKKDGRMMFNPSSQTRIEGDDTLIALGENESLNRLAAILSRR